MFVALGFENPSFMHAISCVNWYHSRLTSLMDGNENNPLQDAGVQALYGAMQAQEHKLDHFALAREQIMDCLE